MDAIIRLAKEADKELVLDILNHYILNSYAAYPKFPVPFQAWEPILASCRDNNLWVAEIPGEGVVGFAMLKWYMTKETFAHTAETGYFIYPEHKGKGLGKRLLTALELAAKQIGVTILVANISSLNPESLAFHKRAGFVECGRIPAVGEKNGNRFDIVWVVKTLS